MTSPGTILGAAACVLAGAALAFSLTHTGPRGPQGPTGPQGHTGKAAQASRFGVCWEAPAFTQDWADGSSDTWVSYVSIDQPQLQNGVYACPQGETFVSIVPQAQGGQG